MLVEIDPQTPDIQVSPAASQAVLGILKERNLKDFALRIYAIGCGCGTVRFGMALDKEVKEADTVINSGGIKLVADNEAISLLQGASIDFVNDPERGAGFLINSPKADSQNEGCGCGGSNCC